MSLPVPCTAAAVRLARSYTGDVRMGVAEDRGKVSRILKGSLSALRSIYAPHLRQAYEWQLLRPGDAPGTISRNSERAVECKMVECLPPAVLRRAAAAMGFESGPCAEMSAVQPRDAEDIVKGIPGAGMGEVAMVDESLGATFLGMRRVQEIASRVVSCG